MNDQRDLEVDLGRQGVRVPPALQGYLSVALLQKFSPFDHEPQDFENLKTNLIAGYFYLNGPLAG